ncbi:MAG: hypothetical protein CV045_12205, partial [Cyanobacteria bacterium M5B4]
EVVVEGPGGGEPRVAIALEAALAHIREPVAAHGGGERDEQGEGCATGIAQANQGGGNQAFARQIKGIVFRYIAHAPAPACVGRSMPYGGIVPQEWGVRAGTQTTKTTKSTKNTKEERLVGRAPCRPPANVSYRRTMKGR